MSVWNPTSERVAVRAAATQERRRAILERRYARRLAAEFRRTNRDAAERYAAGGDIDLAIVEHRRRLQALIRDLYTRSITLGAEAVLEDAPKSFSRVDTKSAESVLERLMSEWVRNNSLTKASNISKTSKKVLQRVINSGLAEGQGVAKIAKAMVDKTRGLSRSRAITIARTETHAAAQNASLSLAQEVAPPGMGKQWVSVGDDRTRSSHRNVNGTLVAMGDKFDVGGSKLSHPGDPNGAPGQVINCRCVLVYKRLAENV